MSENTEKQKKQQPAVTGWDSCGNARERERRAFLKIKEGSACKLIIAGPPSAMKREGYLSQSQKAEGVEAPLVLRFQIPVYVIETGELATFETGPQVFDQLMVQRTEYERDLSRAVFNIRHPEKTAYNVDFVRDANDIELAGMAEALKVAGIQQAAA